ncbi:MAG TPA: hypothetical protein EYN91_12015 [Candidatus Melainabacteria bacterium]|jgi:hypothetical protein|nr:hypothetical protein [Candidatus Melainabacteria bacterium]HIN64488.1 hypothetical protein [Candidatus Obscuribacterales bacterium]
MTKLSKRLLTAATLCLPVSAFVQFAIAQGQFSELSAAPFVAAESPNTPSMSSSIVSNAKRSPYMTATHVPKASAGTYSGIVITPDNPAFEGSFRKLTLDYKGPPDSACYIDYRPPTGTWMRSSVFLSEGKTVASQKDGFKTIQLSNKQFGISEASLIKRITIVPPPQKKAGKLLADAIYFNDSPVKKVMDTLFFQVDGGSPAGPLAFSLPRAVRDSSSPPTSATQFAVSNKSKYTQNVYFTIGLGQPACAIPYANQIPLFIGTTPVSWTATTDPTTFYFALPGGQTAKSQLTSTQMLTGLAIAFGTAANNCNSPPPAIQAFPQGTTKAEFSINTYCWTNDYSHNETADISINGGNNAFLDMRFGGLNANQWLVIEQTGINGQFQNYKLTNGVIKNFCQGDNVNNPGVYPYGCTNCTAGPPASPCPSVTTCNSTSTPICQLNRTACLYGGNITVVFKSYDPSTVSSGNPGDPTYFAPIATSCPPVKFPALTQYNGKPCP